MSDGCSNRCAIFTNSLDLNHVMMSIEQRYAVNDVVEEFQAARLDCSSKCCNSNVFLKNTSVLACENRKVLGKLPKFAVMVV